MQCTGHSSVRSIVLLQTLVMAPERAEVVVAVAVAVGQERGAKGVAAPGCMEKVGSSLMFCGAPRDLCPPEARWTWLRERCSMEP